jgi:hypothetical protein
VIEKKFKTPEQKGRAREGVQNILKSVPTKRKNHNEQIAFGKSVKVKKQI